jgi:acetyl esterase/lipase
MHGTEEALVPYAQAVSMANALRSAQVPVTFLPLSHTGHTFPDLATPPGQRILDAIVAFLRHTPAASAQARKGPPASVQRADGTDTRESAAPSPVAP